MLTLHKSNPKTFCVLEMIEFSSSNQHWGSDKGSVLPSATRPGGENKQKAGTNRFSQQLLKHWLRSWHVTQNRFMWFGIMQHGCRIILYNFISCNMIYIQCCLPWSPTVPRPYGSKPLQLRPIHDWPTKRCTRNKHPIKRYSWCS